MASVGTWSHSGDFSSECEKMMVTIKKEQGGFYKYLQLSERPETKLDLFLCAEYSLYPILIIRPIRLSSI